MAVKQITLEDINRGGCTNTKNTQIVLSLADSGFGLTPASAHQSMRHVSFEDYGDLDHAIQEKGSPADFDVGDTQVTHVFGTDFSTVLDDLETVIQRSNTHCEAVIIDGLQQLGSTAEEISTRLQQLQEILEPTGGELAIIDPDPAGSDIHSVDPSSTDFDWLVRALNLASSAALRRHRKSIKSEIQRWAQIDKEGGRAGIGFEWVEVDGETEWVPGENYDEVCSVLELVRDGEMSKRQAAADLGTSPRTITRCIEERAARYGL